MRTEEPEAAAIREEDLRLEATAPEIEAQDAPLVLREIASGAKEEEPILDRVEMIAPSAMGLADSLGIASMDLLRLVDLARANKDHAAVIRDPASRRPRGARPRARRRPGVKLAQPAPHGSWDKQLNQCHL